MVAMQMNLIELHKRYLKSKLTLRRIVATHSNPPWQASDFSPKNPNFIKHGVSFVDATNNFGYELPYYT